MLAWLSHSHDLPLVISAAWIVLIIAALVGTGFILVGMWEDLSEIVRDEMTRQH